MSFLQALFGQVSTSTSATTLNEVFGLLPGVFEALANAGWLAGLVATLGVGLAVLNLRQVRDVFMRDDIDWIRPALIAIIVGVEASLTMLIAVESADAASVVTAGLVAAFGSGFVQRAVQEWLD